MRPSPKCLFSESVHTPCHASGSWQPHPHRSHSRRTCAEATDIVLSSDTDFSSKLGVSTSDNIMLAAPAPLVSATAVTAAGGSVRGASGMGAAAIEAVPVPVAVVVVAAAEAITLNGLLAMRRGLIASTMLVAATEATAAEAIEAA